MSVVLLELGSRLLVMHDELVMHELVMHDAASEISPEADITDEWGIIPRTIITASAHAMARLNQVADNDLPHVLSRLSVTDLGYGIGAAMSKLSEDQHRSIFGHLCNALDPRAAVDFSSASWGLRTSTEDLREDLRVEHEAVAALCLKVGVRSCKELHEAKQIVWIPEGHYLAKLAKAQQCISSPSAAVQHLEGSQRRARLVLCIGESAAMQRLLQGLGMGSLPVVTMLNLSAMRVGNLMIGMHVGDAGAAPLAAALGRGALPRLMYLYLSSIGIGDAGLVALAPALRRLPGLETLGLGGNPLGDEGLAALVAPPLPAGARVLTKLGALDLSITQVSDPGCSALAAGGLTMLKVLGLVDSQVTDAGCAALAAALDSGALPALETIKLVQLDKVRASSFELQPALALPLTLTPTRSPRHHTP